VTLPVIGEDFSRQNWVTQAEDDVDGIAILESDNHLRQVDDPAIGGNTVGGSITISCNPPSLSPFPVGVTTVQCTAVDASGNTGTASFTVRVNRPPIESPFLAQEQEQPPAAEEETPVQEEEEAPVQEEQPPAAEEEQPLAAEDEGAAAAPANDEGGGG
ncbi:MAG: HYR domain-containing protein, partial [Thermoproteota archaeon]|nr:HYR domain-containing protein [Thermoproteota archaeon]